MHGINEECSCEISDMLGDDLIFRDLLWDKCVDRSFQAYFILLKWRRASLTVTEQHWPLYAVRELT